MPTEVIQRISQVLGMTEEQVLAVLYTYYVETVQSCLLDPQNQTKCIYGMLYLDDNNKLQVDSITPVKDTKLLGESDLFQMVKIIGQGPGHNVFSGK
jgi:hypothetical protein